MQAIAKTIEALRGIARWGTGDMLEAAFTEFALLPGPSDERLWHEVLGMPHAVVAPCELLEAYRRAASAAHPDRGGSHERMVELNAA